MVQQGAKSEHKVFEMLRQNLLNNLVSLLVEKNPRKKTSFRSHLTLGKNE